MSKKKYFAMVNTFNVLTNKTTYDDVFSSNIGYVYVEPHKDIGFNHINEMINYFEGLEMYENCAELLFIRREDFNDDGTKKPNAPKCECIHPKVSVYSLYSRCGTCNLRIL